MTWIKTIPQREASDELREAMQRFRGCYPPEYATEVDVLQQVASRDRGGSISDSHSLLPDTLYHAFMTLGTLLSPDLPLSRRQHEMIATTVSVLNECFYWIESHAEFLRRVTNDDALVAALRNDFRTADLPPADRAMLEYVEKLTLEAISIQREDVQGLREVGFDDTAILQINLIASWFNYINRVADGLGVGRP